MNLLFIIIVIIVIYIFYTYFLNSSKSKYLREGLEGVSSEESHTPTESCFDDIKGFFSKVKKIGVNAVCKHCQQTLQTSSTDDITKHPDFDKYIAKEKVNSILSSTDWKYTNQAAASEVANEVANEVVANEVVANEVANEVVANKAANKAANKVPASEVLTEKKSIADQVASELVEEPVSNTPSKYIQPKQTPVNYDKKMYKKPITSKQELNAYGWSYMPPVAWSVPQQRPPVCIPDRTPTVCPVIDKGTPANAVEFTQVGSILPKFTYKEEYDPDYFYPGWHTQKRV